VTHYLCQELFLQPAAVKAWSGAISTLLRFIHNEKSAAQQPPAPFSFRKQKPALTLPCQCWLSSVVAFYLPLSPQSLCSTHFSPIILS
jgi:hypothetical protein